MKLSIIIPVYNAEKYIEYTLNSIKNQTFKDYEVIIVDDGSTDNSNSICKKIIRDDIRFKLIRTPNGGPARARNIGIKMAKGEYIGFVDADDYIDKDMYEKLIYLADRNKVDIVICGVEYIKQNKVEYKSNLDVPSNCILSKKQIKNDIIKRYYMNKVDGIAPLWNKIYNRQFILRNNLIIDESRIRAEDYWFNMNAFRVANKIYVIKDHLYKYNQSTEMSVMKTYRKNQFHMFVKTREELLKLNNEFMFEIDYDLFDNNFIQETVSFIFDLMKYEKNNKYIKVKKILSNESYHDAIKKCDNVTKPIKLINWFVKKKMYIVVYVLFKFWSFYLSKNNNKKEES